jgi:HD-GYP domain-containing protein (c-di-GMP phosphodiesterase class II)
LAGEQIILEARILAVGDAVEAIASERPYRRALGMDAALDEVMRHRNTLYDSSVVDACVEVIRVDGYTLEEEALQAP